MLIASPEKVCYFLKRIKKNNQLIAGLFCYDVLNLASLRTLRV